MQHKWMVLISILILLSLLVAPASTIRAQAQVNVQNAARDCPHRDPELLRDKHALRSFPFACILAYKEESRRMAMFAEADMQAASASGADEFGYTFSDSVAYYWIPAMTDSGLTGDDEFTGPIDIGFDFPFYGTPQSRLYFSTNGLITFGSGSWEWNGEPYDREPNHLIAPFWDDIVVGSPDNHGAILYSRGGTAPNRYFVVEWRNVELTYTSSAFSFEAILYESGEIVFQYDSLPSPYSYWPVVGIEDSTGFDSLTYDHADLRASKAIQFSHPAPAARLTVSPALQAGGFAPLRGSKDFSVTVMNTGGLGADTYDLTLTSAWPAALYASDGATPLTDTDADAVIDTGSIPQGTSRTVIARFNIPAGTQIGNSNTGTLNVASSLDPSREKTIFLSMSVPASFVNVFQDEADGAMSLMAVDSYGPSTSQVTVNDHLGYGIAITKLTNGNYFYAWGKGYSTDIKWWRDIEYALFSASGSVILSTQKLTDNANTAVYAEDRSPSIAVTPNGTVGVVWSRKLNDPTTGQLNYNVYFATLSASGALLTNPINITNNTTWGISSELNVPRFYSPTIAATDDNNFIIAWEHEQREISGYMSHIWYSVQSATGTSTFPPTELPGDGGEGTPILNSLTGGKAILTWMLDGYGSNYAVIGSDGSIVKDPTSLPSTEEYCAYCSSPDAVQLPNGNVAVAWGSLTGAEMVILDSSYNVVSGPTWAPNPSHPSSSMGETMSVTTDSSSRVIMTWTGPSNRLLYALGDSDGTFITDPMIYKTSGSYIDNSSNGQGNAPYQSSPVIAGNAATANALLSYPGGSTIAETNGYYFFRVPSGWSGTVTPSKTNYTFSPTSKTYTNVTTSQIAQNYTATPVLISISGNTGIGGVMLRYVDGTPKSMISQADGAYSFRVPINWSGAVIPSKDGYIFSPSNRSYTSMTADQTAQDYTPLYTISGNAGAAGVTLTYTDDVMQTVTSQRDGSYSLIVPSGWNGTITPAHTCFTFSPLELSYTEVESNLTEQDYIPSVTADSGCADMDVSIGGTHQGRFGLSAGASTRLSFAGINNGPVKIVSMNNVPLIGAERLIYKVNGTNTSFTEMIGLPNSQLDTVYWLPWYNNKDLDTQLRFANVTDQTATVHVYIGGGEMEGSPFTLLAGESTRKSFIGINNGPVKIVSDQNIVAAERLIYKVDGINTSFSEMMALPNNQLDTTYWLPWYNNKDLDTQLRFANVTDQTATVHVYIGGMEMTGSPFTLLAGESTRKSFPGVNNGPVKIVSDQPIVAAERLIYKVNNVATSFTEMMALPNNQLDSVYWLPWYNNKDLDTQLRFANVTDQTATVHVYIGGMEMPGSPFTLQTGESTRQSFPGVNSGPVQIVSNVKIVTAERLIYRVQGVNTSFSEMMALPDSQLSSTYWFPWYNNANADLDTQLRFAIP